VRARDRINKALGKIYEPARVRAGQTFKGYTHNSHFAGDGWWHTPFGGTPIYLGDSVKEALSTIDHIEDEREVVHG